MQIDAETGGSRARFTMRASRRGSNLFPYREAWLEDTTQFRVDPKSAKDAMAEEAPMFKQVLEDAAERLGTYTGAELAAHTLVATDGHSAVGVPGQVRAGAPVVATAVTTAPRPASRPPPRPAAQPYGYATQPAQPNYAQPNPAQPQPAQPVQPGFTPEEFPSPPPPGAPPEVEHDPNASSEVFTGSPGKYVGLAEIIRGFQLIISRELDGIANFYSFYHLTTQNPILVTTIFNLTI